MSDKKTPKKPYGDLGKRLKTLREQASESLAEVSEALEVDVKDLSSFESGNNRPSIEVLIMLINHFNAQDDEAISLWHLAGYNLEELPTGKLFGDLNQAQPKINKHAVVILPIDARIIYSDSVKIMANKNGVTFSFMQSIDNSTEPLAVSRIGMSREHAKKVLDILKSTLEYSEQDIMQTEQVKPPAIDADEKPKN